MKSLKRLGNHFQAMGMGKTFFATYFIVCNVPDMINAYWFWCLLVGELAMSLQKMVNRAYKPHPDQAWFDEVNEARNSRLHRERMTTQLIAKGYTPDVAERASSLTMDVLSFTDYKLAPL